MNQVYQISVELNFDSDRSIRLATTNDFKDFERSNDFEENKPFDSLQDLQQLRNMQRVSATGMDGI